MKQPEHILQVNCVNYFRLRYPKGLIYAIPNGGQRNVIVASKLKSEGVLSGVPDLHIPMAKKVCTGFILSLKMVRLAKYRITKKRLWINYKVKATDARCAYLLTSLEMLLMIICCSKKKERKKNLRKSNFFFDFLKPML